MTRVSPIPTDDLQLSDFRCTASFQSSTPYDNPMQEFPNRGNYLRTKTCEVADTRNEIAADSSCFGHQRTPLNTINEFMRNRYAYGIARSGRGYGCAFGDWFM